MSTSPEFDAWVEKARSAPIADIMPPGLKKKGKELVGPCPRCGGTDRFAINPAKEIFNCRVCGGGKGAKGTIDLAKFRWDCDFNTAIERITGEPKPSKPNGKDRAAPAAKKVAVKSYPYSDENGTVRYYRDRIEFQNSDGTFVSGKHAGKRKKEFMARRPDLDRPGEWVYDLKGVTRLPFMLPEMLDGDRTVELWLFEGEEKAALAQQQGLQATSSDGGCNWPTEITRWFDGRRVWVCPDANKPGREYAQKVAIALDGIASEVRIVELPTSADGAPAHIKAEDRNVEVPTILDGQDIKEFLQNGGTADHLRLLGELAPIWQPNGNGIFHGAKGLREHSQPNAPKAEDRLILTVTEFLHGFVSPNYVVDGLWKRGFFYSLTAMTGGGKTAIALTVAELASNRKRRRKLGSHEVEHVRVVYIACENADDVRGRLIGMEARMDFDRADLDMLVIDKVFDLEKNMERIKKEVEVFGGNIGLVIIDTSAAMFQGDDENSNPQMIGHAKTQRRLCDLPGRPCVVALNHPTKSVASPELLLPRGGGGYLNETDGNFTAWARGDRLTTLHWAGKLRGPDFDPIEFRLPIVTTTKLTDAKGRLMPTVMAEVVTDAQVEETEQRATFQEDRLLAAISANPDGSLAEWAHGCGWTLQGKPGEPPVPNKSLVRRVIARLQKSKLVSKDGRGFTLTKAGKKAASTNQSQDPKEP